MASILSRPQYVRKYPVIIVSLPSGYEAVIPNMKLQFRIIKTPKTKTISDF